MEMSVSNEFDCLFLGSPKHEGLPECRVECGSKNTSKELPVESLKEHEKAESTSTVLFPLASNRALQSSHSEQQESHRNHVLQNAVITDLNRRMGERTTGLNRIYCRLLKKLKVSKTSQSCSICQHAF